MYQCHGRSDSGTSFANFEADYLGNRSGAKEGIWSRLFRHFGFVQPYLTVPFSVQVLASSRRSSSSFLSVCLFLRGWVHRFSGWESGLSSECPWWNISTLRLSRLVQRSPQVYLANHLFTYFGQFRWHHADINTTWRARHELNNPVPFEFTTINVKTGEVIPVARITFAIRLMLILLLT